MKLDLYQRWRRLKRLTKAVVLLVVAGAILAYVARKTYSIEGSAMGDELDRIRDLGQPTTLEELVEPLARARKK